ncbi:aminoglycoside phosphotransferase family protein [Streptomyces sp. TLI_146]|uniref:aminoglycoside phosphotransferase family protein n=1 Tax=Streptomyces sp. TLI_146 TaxID=1938858 RepID=UPI000C701DE3|nr:aminoglycoside phosphotransferase family protein [Streptomyces sp. TLI_146]PKV86503.1 phosphotransferase family enzyme [Streptomyces sp. TLI_146]
MAPETASTAREVAVKLSRDGDRGVYGPLQGHHHEAYAIVLPSGNPLGEGYARGKLRMRREGLLWFDRRTFASEDELLMALRGRVSRIPECAEFMAGLFLQGFVEGRTLREGRFGLGRMSERHVGQLGKLFGEMAAVKPGELTLETLSGDPPWLSVQDGDTPGFLRGMIDFTQDEVYEKNRGEFGSLFDRLGVSATSLNGLRERAETLAERPFSLVHGDLHRRNLIVDSRGDLWFIDWELAMIGDPLYDLATHLHLMNYPECDARRVKEVWRRAVEAARPRASNGWERDLPHLLAFKQAQSVYTDIIRTAVGLLVGAGALALVAGAATGPGPGRLRLARAARKVQRVLAMAKDALGLRGVPTRREIREAYGEWLRGRRG